MTKKTTLLTLLLGAACAAGMTEEEFDTLYHR